MTCSWASRLISPVVDDSDDKTTTFTLLLFNFYLFPQALLSITDFSQPLSVFLSVHLSFPFSSPLLSFPGAFCLFIPPCHELTTFFLSHCVFYMSLHFSSLFVPSQFPRGLLSLSLSVLWNQYFSICVHSSLSFFYPAAFSVCVFITLSTCLCLPSFLSSILTSCRLVYFMLFFSSSQVRFGTLLRFLLIWLSELSLSLFTFFPPWMLRLSCRDKSASSAFSSLWYFFCTLRRGIIEH